MCEVKTDKTKKLTVSSEIGLRVFEYSYIKLARVAVELVAMNRLVRLTWILSSGLIDEYGGGIDSDLFSS